MITFHTFPLPVIDPTKSTEHRSRLATISRKHSSSLWIRAALLSWYSAPQSSKTLMLLSPTVNLSVKMTAPNGSESSFSTFPVNSTEKYNNNGNNSFRSMTAKVLLSLSTLAPGVEKVAKTVLVTVTHHCHLPLDRGYYRLDCDQCFLCRHGQRDSFCFPFGGPHVELLQNQAPPHCLPGPVEQRGFDLRDDFKM